MIRMELVRWSDLGFPKEEGLYHLGGIDIWVNSVRLKQAEEWIASGNDDAVFQLVILESYAGSLELRLGELQTGFTRPLGLSDLTITLGSESKIPI
jgi:hypothetical protein